MIRIDSPIQPSRPVRLPHPKEYLSERAYDKLRDTIQDMIGNEFSKALEAEGRNSESVKDFDAGWVQENLEDEFHDQCTQAICDVLHDFRERAGKEL